MELYVEVFSEIIAQGCHYKNPVIQLVITYSEDIFRFSLVIQIREPSSFSRHISLLNK